MTEIVAHNVSVTDEDNQSQYFQLMLDTTTISTEDTDNPLMVDFGESYVVTVRSINSIGAGEANSTSFSKQLCVLFVNILCIV